MIYFISSDLLFGCFAGFTLLAVDKGVQYILPANVLVEPLNQNTPSDITTSLDHAVVETAAGKRRGYARNDIFTFKGISYGALKYKSGGFMPPEKPAS